MGGWMEIPRLTLSWGSGTVRVGDRIGQRGVFREGKKCVYECMYEYYTYNLCHHPGTFSPFSFIYLFIKFMQS